MSIQYSIDDTIRQLLNNYDKQQPITIDHDYINLSSTQKIMYNFGKGSRKFINFLKLPETKAAVLLANWALSATILVMTAIFASTPAIMFAALALFLIETYAVFGVTEYAIAYGIANRIVKVSQ
jgi:hypothetical protein